MSIFVECMVVLGVIGSVIAILVFLAPAFFGKGYSARQCPNCSNVIDGQPLKMSATVKCKCGARAIFSYGSIVDWEIPVERNLALKKDAPLLNSDEPWKREIRTTLEEATVKKDEIQSCPAA